MATAPRKKPPARKAATTTPKAPARRRPGRPSKIDQPVATTPEGQLVTAGDRIIQALAVGDYLESAAAAAGVHKDTVYAWLRTGAHATAQLARQPLHPTTPTHLTEHEERCRQFSDAVARVTAEWHQRSLATLEQLGRGGVTVTVVTERQDAQGQVVERTVRTETKPPDATVLMWRLRQRFPEKYGARVDVVGLVPELAGVDEDRAASLAELLSAFQAGAAAGAEVEAMGREVPGAGQG